MTAMEAKRSRRFLTTSISLPHWCLISIIVTTAFVRNGTPQDTSLALVWSTKLAADGRGSVFILYGDPNTYRDQMQKNMTISSKLYIRKASNSSHYIAIETDFARSKLYYSESAEYLSFGDVNISQRWYLEYFIPIPAVSNLVTGLTVDWVSNLIYWSDAIYQRICVVDTNYYLFWRPVVEYGLSSPQDIAVYPQQGVLFWSDSSLKIERLDLATNIRQVIVPSDHLLRPTTLVIDFVTQRLLWLDSAATRIGFVNFDGSGLFFWPMQLFSSISSFTIFKDYIFLGDKTQPISYAYNFTDKSFVGCVTAENTTGVIDMAAFAPEKQPSFTSPCSLNNGGCNHFCITKSSTESVCQCAMGFFLDSSGTTCNPALLEDNFLLVSDRYQHNIFQVDIGRGEVRAASVTPNDLFEITAMDYDSVSKTVYGFDSAKYLIRKVTLVDHVTSTVLDSQGKVISSLVVDTVGRLLYYVNYDSGAVMRASLLGDDKREVVSGDGTLATAIALDVHNRSMFWSDCSVGRRSIEKAQISNPSSHQTVVTISGTCATAIAIDSLNQLIFWADNTGRIEQVGYSGTGRLLIRQLSSTSSVRGLAVDSNFVYISDSKQRLIQRIDRSSNEISNLTGIRFTNPYAITLFRSVPMITPSSGSTSASTGTTSSNESVSSNETGSTSPPAVSSTTVILAAVICSSVVLIAAIVTLAVIFARRCKRNGLKDQGPTMTSEEMEQKDNAGYETLVLSRRIATAKGANTTSGNTYAFSSPINHSSSQSQPTSKNDRCTSIYDDLIDPVLEPPLPPPRPGEINPRDSDYLELENTMQPDILN